MPEELWKGITPNPELRLSMVAVVRNLLIDEILGKRI
jgi:hypothetical protein